MRTRSTFISWTSLALVSIVFLFDATEAWAAVKTWSGATDGVWSKPSNWVGGIAPVAGDSLVFPPVSSAKVLTNDLANGFSVLGLSFDGGYLVGGNSITLGSGGISCPGSGTNSAVIGIALTAATTIDVAANSGTLNLAGVISGAFDITKTGIGLVKLSGANTFSKKVTINDGYMIAASASALGTGDGTAATGTVVNTGGTLQIGADIANEAITVFGQGHNNNGVLQVSNGTLSLGGPVTLGDANVEMASLAGDELVFNGVVGGSGRFGIGGGATFTLANPGNSFSGPTRISGSAKLKLGASNVIPDATVLLFTSGSGLFDLNNFKETIAGIDGSVNVLIPASSTLTINQSVDSSFSGRFYGAGNVVKTGTGKLTLPFEHFLTGTISSFVGTLIVGGNLPGKATVAPGAVLGGSGTIGQLLLATGGTVAPGSSPGILSTGGLSLSANSTLSLELNGPVAGTGYDQVAVTGAVSLGGSALGISLGFAPAPGTVFTIISNDGVDPVNGTFAGLPQGAIITANGTPLVISYTGGTGNDVVLIAGGPRTLDVDADGSYEAPTDGLLIIRYLLGLTGAPLTSGALGAAATRTDPALIKTYLDGVRPLLDIDGNGTSDALTDGLMILRYQFGLRASSLIAGAVGSGASRTTATDIEPYILSLMP